MGQWRTAATAPAWPVLTTQWARESAASGESELLLWRSTGDEWGESATEWWTTTAVAAEEE